MLSTRKEEMKHRAIELAKFYGPFVRFFPEGSEGEGGTKADGDAVSKAIAEAEEADLKDNKVYTKTQQALDQEKANAQRARDQAAEAQATATEVQGQLDTQQQENKGLKEQLAALESKAADQGIATAELKAEDYEGTDVALVNAINSLRGAIKAKDTRIENLEKAKSNYEVQAKADTAKLARNADYNELLQGLDTEYGTEHRNAAVAKFNQRVADGKVQKGSPTKATRAMEQCYKEAAKEAKEKAGKDKSSISLDTGSGGGSPPSLSGVKLKKGSLDEVHAQAAAAARTS